MGQEHKDISGLLANESFIAYCKNTSAKDVAYWQEYLRDHPGEKELLTTAKEQFNLLFNSLATMDKEEQLQKMRDLLVGKAAVPVVETDGWAELTPRLLKFGKRALAVAAVLVAGFLLIQYWLSPASTGSVKAFETAYGERKNVQLPDGTTVSLNAGSRVHIDADFGLKVRNVYLEGEAFFDVKHNKEIPFIVHTNTMAVRALGTAFDVKAYSEETTTETSLIRGLVEVTLKQNDNQVVLLHPNQKITWVTRNKQQKEPADVEKEKQVTALAEPIPHAITPTDHGEIKEVAWCENKLIFEDDTLGDIAVQLERWYGIPIIFENEDLKSYRFTAAFEKEDLSTVLAFLKESRYFNFRIEGGDTQKIFLSK